MSDTNPSTLSTVLSDMVDSSCEYYGGQLYTASCGHISKQVFTNLKTKRYYWSLDLAYQEYCERCELLLKK